METKWLEDFVSLAETRSFSRSAQLRHVTQPAFSRRIQALEAWAGIDLVDRSAYPTRLTAAGETLHAQALEVLVALGPLIEGPELDELLARVARVEQAAADDARRAECAVWRGRAYARALAWGKADAAFEAARRLQSTSIEALRPWIDHLIETRRHAQAAEALRAAAAAPPRAASPRRVNCDGDPAFSGPHAACMPPRTPCMDCW